MPLTGSMPMLACNMFYPVDQRYIRWLRMVGDFFNGAEIPLTHELMAAMLDTSERPWPESCVRCTSGPRQ